MFWEGFFFWMANASAIVGLITAAIAGIAWWRLREERRKLKQRLAILSHQPKGEQVAIAIGLGASASNIQGTVSKYLAGQGLTMRLLYHSDPADVTPETARDLVEALLELRRELNLVSPTQIHFFYGGPVFLGPALGIALANWIPTLIYYFKEGTYHPMMRLDRDLIASRAGTKEHSAITWQVKEPDDAKAE